MAISTGMGFDNNFHYYSVVNKYLLRSCFELQIQIKTNYAFLLTGYLPPSDAELDPAGGLKT